MNTARIGQDDSKEEWGGFVNGAPLLTGIIAMTDYEDLPQCRSSMAVQLGRGSD